MGGGLLQLVAYGAQDVYLTGNPQITFFKMVYKRHTNFSMESIEQTWDGSGGNADGPGRSTVIISRNGDLIYDMHLEFIGNMRTSISNPTSQVIIDIELEIGGQSIDKQTGQWMNIWSQLTEPNPSAISGICTKDGTTLNSPTLFQKMSGMGGCFSNIDDDNEQASQRHFIPLQFWFCRKPGLSLPLIALQYHEVKIILNHDFSKSYNNKITNKLWVDYIFLDTDERRRFAQVSHEYLIEQIQENKLLPGQSSPLHFNHPVKELIWCHEASRGRLIGIIQGTYKVKLNGHDRFEERDYTYFTRSQIWKHHTGVGGIDSRQTTPGAAHRTLNDSIAVYSFALKPEEHQPSGTCNFSRIDNAELIGSSTTTTNKIYAINYNILRIMSGMGGLAFSN